MTAPVFVALSDLLLSDEFQMRLRLASNVVDEYAELIEQAGGVWPFRDPCSVVRVKSDLILVDGFHRVAAMKKAGEDQIQVVITDGSRLDAKKLAFAANQYHGLRLSNADKRHKVTIALNDSTLGKWSDRKLAELCGVSDSFISSMRAEVRTDCTSAPENTEETRTGSDGKTYPASKAAAEAQRQQIVDALNANSKKSNREIAKAVGCDDKTVAKVRKELEKESAVIADDEEPESDDSPEADSEPRDMLDMFEDMKQLVRDAMHEFPQNQRAIIWRQLVEQLQEEDVLKW